MARTTAIEQDRSGNSLQHGLRPRRQQRPANGHGTTPLRAQPAASLQPRGRLSMLLALLVVTTLLLIVLQGYRALYGPLKLGRGPHGASSSSSSSSQRGWQGPWQKSTGSMAARPSSQLSGTADDNLDWRGYLATMRKHFDEEIARVRGRDESGSEASGAGRQKGAAVQRGAGGGGMAAVPGQGVRDHPVANRQAHAAAADKKPQHVEGKSSAEAEEDRRIALEDIDQETLKAMYDALQDAGVRL